VAADRSERPAISIEGRQGVSEMATDVFIVSATRTAMGRYLGGFATLSAPQLGAITIREAINRAGVAPDQVDEVIMGNVLQGGVGQAPARQAAIKAGIPDTVPAFTINKVCGSGLKAVMLASQAIKCGDADVIVAGGMESMSLAPYYLPKARTGYRMGHSELVDGMIYDGLWCSFGNYHMGVAAEVIAEKFNVTREEQDEYAVGSHNKAVAAMKEGKFKKEIVPVEVPQRKKDPIVVDTDESPREGSSVEALSKLRPAFKKDGTVTAGNAPGINDGASALVVASGRACEKMGLKKMARIMSYTASGTAPEMLFYAPVLAVRDLAEKDGLKLDDYGLFEANEAFSAQAVADGKELGWDWSRVNVNGGAVALGHPIGASGARVLTTLLYAMEDRNVEKGMATLCLGGGNAVALSVERA
jgi:acetyl-CoA C-acetyltransferase